MKPEDVIQVMFEGLDFGKISKSYSFSGTFRYPFIKRVAEKKDGPLVVECSYYGGEASNVYGHKAECSISISGDVITTVADEMGYGIDEIEDEKYSFQAQMSAVFEKVVESSFVPESSRAGAALLSNLKSIGFVSPYVKYQFHDIDGFSFVDAMTTVSIIIDKWGKILEWERK